MKTVFTNREIVHIYASRSQREGRANSMHFSGDTFYSYSQPIGQFVDEGRAILLNREHFSITTSAHQAKLFQAVNHYTNIYVGHINEYGRVSEHNKKWYAEEIAANLKKASRARADHMVRWYLGRAQGLIDSMTEYVRIFKLDWTVPVIPEDLTAIRDAAKKEAAEESAATKKRKAERAIEVAEAERKWLNGEGNYAPNFYDRPTLLRIVGDNVETSQGAKFPVADAARGLALVRSVKARGIDWTPNGQTCRLGHYSINRILGNGDVKAGCHYVPWASIETIASQLEVLSSSLTEAERDESVNPFSVGGAA